MASSTLSSALISIAAVERDTGLSKDTLRVWERRYGFPQPLRDAFGERVYPLEQVDRLRLVKRLMDQGYRPGKIMGHAPAELQALAEASGASRSVAVAELTPELAQFIALVRSHEVEELRSQLAQMQVRIGLARFAIEVVGPLTELVGEAWTRGELEVFEEHLYTEAIQGVLRQAIGGIPRPGLRPRVLLTTVPGEPHGLGLLMAEAMFALEGARCISLGVQTPLWDIVLAARAQNADVVALSFSSLPGPAIVLDSLRELRGKLPGSTELWAGGGSATLQRRAPPGVQVLRGLDSVASELARWRRQHDS
jgi:DNA-binding transcriptional MerR regulator/methylmalonyl-CoA mutase cobalamin-binding subunit